MIARFLIPINLDQGLARRGPLLHLAQALDGPLAFLAEERVLEALASVTQDLRILGHAYPPAHARDSMSRRRHACLRGSFDDRADGTRCVRRARSVAAGRAEACDLTPARRDATLCRSAPL
jgi:hypothetical protein